jgi:hypothetical protein
MSQIGLIKQVLYDLKRGFGEDGIFKVVTRQGADYISGVVANNVQQFVVHKVIMLPEEQSRLLLLGRLITGDYNKAPKINKKTRLFIVDGKELPVGYVPKIDHYIIFGGDTYRITTIEQLEYQLGYLITGEENVT